MRKIKHYIFTVVAGLVNSACSASEQWTLKSDVLNLQLSTSPKAHQERLALPGILLATNYNSTVDVKRFYVSEKLDGVRAYWNGTNLLTRTGRVIHAPAWFLRRLPSEELDGELWIDRQKFDLVSGIIRRKTAKDEDWRQVKYMVFDQPDRRKTYTQRVKYLQQLISTSNFSNLKFVHQYSINSNDELQQFLSDVVSKNGEGVMLHRKDSTYKGYRHTDLQKLKPYDDAEATVLRHIEGHGKYKGLMGAVEVISEDGIKFKIGSGFTREQRKHPPPIKSTITYRYRGLTKNSVPRFATFLRMKTD
ncbi:MAG: DNA ligase [Kangiellaceae bacterium]|nr:DNA ligase [Kangiellaceae bacterium]